MCVRVWCTTPYSDEHMWCMYVLSWGTPECLFVSIMCMCVCVCSLSSVAVCFVCSCLCVYVCVCVFVIVWCTCMCVCVCVYCIRLFVSCECAYVGALAIVRTSWDVHVCLSVLPYIVCVWWCTNPLCAISVCVFVCVCVYASLCAVCSVLCVCVIVLVCVCERIWKHVCLSSCDMCFSDQRLIVRAVCTDVCVCVWHPCLQIF